MKTTNLVFLALLVGCLKVATAQLSAPPPFALGTIEVKREVLPNTKSVWLKLIANYSTVPKWMDGLAFNFTAIVKATGEAGQGLRLLTGTVTYINVPGGKHQAMLYFSPGATARFGEPIAMEVTCFKGDEQIGSATWTGGGGSKEDLKRPDIRRFDGFLLGVRSTPWLVIDSEKTPDVFLPIDVFLPDEKMEVADGK